MYLFIVKEIDWNAEYHLNKIILCRAGKTVTFSFFEIKENKLVMSTDPYI